MPNDYFDPVEAARRRLVPQTTGQSYFPAANPQQFQGGNIFSPQHEDQGISMANTLLSQQFTPYDLAASYQARQIQNEQARARAMNEINTPTTTPTPVPRPLSFGLGMNRFPKFAGDRSDINDLLNQSPETQFLSKPRPTPTPTPSPRSSFPARTSQFAINQDWQKKYGWSG